MIFSFWNTPCSRVQRVYLLRIKQYEYVYLVHKVATTTQF